MTAESEQDALVYDRGDDLTGSDSLSEVARRIAPASTVLDLGAATGALGRKLRESGCTVDGAEIDPKAAEKARPHYRTLRELDLEQVDLRAHFATGAYDTIVCADVLEHLRDPGRILDQLPALLAPEGFALLSIPNVGYAGVVADLIAGEFRYRPTGLLDRTHLRFFTRASLLQLLRQHGFYARAFSTIDLDPLRSEFQDARLRALAPGVLRAVLAQPDALAYQFIVEARPGIGPEVPAPTAAEGPRFAVQLYWTADGSLREERSAIAGGIMGEERQSIALDIPPLDPPPKGLRLDPADRPGIIAIHRLCLLDDAGRPIWSWDHDPRSLPAMRDLMVLTRLAESRWISTSEDPSVDLPVGGEALSALVRGGKLVLEMSWPMSSDYLLATAIVDERERAWKRERDALLASTQETRRAAERARTDLLEAHDAVQARFEAAVRERQRVFEAENRSLAHQLNRLHQRLSALEGTATVGGTIRRLRRELGFGAIDFELQPAHDVREIDAAAGLWEATGVDPHFLLAPKSGRFPNGWTALSLELSHELYTPLPAALYVDGGGGFSESAAIQLAVPSHGRIAMIVQLPPWVGAFRLDPVDVPGPFRLRNVRMQELGKVGAAARIAMPSARKLLEDPRRIPSAVRDATELVRKDGVRGLRHWLRERVQHAAGGGSYRDWIAEFDRLRPRDEARIAARLADMKARPRFSVLMPVYNPPERWLQRAIDSVRGQLYPEWELCIADDGSTAPHVRAVLEKAAQADQRIKVAFRSSNGHISVASNSALELASGEFVVMLDHDDELAPHALYLFAEELQSHPDAVLIYSDEDKIDEAGERYDPHFKTDWNPELLHSINYVAHLMAVRTARVREIGAFRVGFEGSQDFDLCLRATAGIEASRMRHVPHVLYHWRAIHGSTAALPANKSYASEAGMRALEDHFASATSGVRIEAGPLPTTYRVRHPLPDNPPLVSVLMPTRDGRQVLDRAIGTVLRNTTYPRFELVVIDNQSSDAQTLASLQELEGSGKGRVLRYDRPFNFSAINNFAVSRAKGDVVVLLNDDVAVIEPDWLTELVTRAIQPGIGCVGAKLLYPDDAVQHAGVLLGLYGVAGHVFRGIPRDAQGYFARALLPQALSAVTGACLAVRKSIYQEVGGLDEENLPVAFNDIDFCIRVREAGYRNVWTPFALLHHHESVSRGREDTPEKRARFGRECEYMKRRWGRVLMEDPFYNPNLSLQSEQMEVAWPPRAAKPWKTSR